jgi:hypothetical protein
MKMLNATGAKKARTFFRDSEFPVVQYMDSARYLITGSGGPIKKQKAN